MSIAVRCPIEDHYATTAEMVSAWHAKARLFLDEPEGGRSRQVAEEVEANLAWHSLRNEEGVRLRFWDCVARPSVLPTGWTTSWT